MYVLRFWPDCSLLPGPPDDAYYVECTVAELRVRDCGPAIRLPDQDSLCTLLAANDRFAASNPSLAEFGCLYFLVSSDGTRGLLEPAHFPYAGQWNGPTPLLPIGRIRISSTLDLSRFSESLFSAAVSNYVDVRDSFRRLHELGLVSGNDNHVGDIGEYYVLRLLRRSDPDLKLSPKKNSGYDMETSGGTRISVKTMTPWSSRRKGTPIKYDLGHWGVLYAVLLDEALRPERMAAVPLDELRRREPFRENERRRQSGVRSYPLFQWWDWLKDYVVNLPDNL